MRPRLDGSKRRLSARAGVISFNLERSTSVGNRMRSEQMGLRHCHCSSKPGSMVLGTPAENSFLTDFLGDVCHYEKIDIRTFAH